MEIAVNDDFDLKKIAYSGQCFRVKELPGGLFRFITGSHAVYIAAEEPGRFSVNCSEEEWEKIWFPYFDLGRNYRAIRTLIPTEDEFMTRAAECSKGIRILAQDPWETLISFIISQRKNIHAIKKSIEAIATLYGHELETPYERLFTFPTAEEMTAGGVTLPQLLECRTGYRAAYILDAVTKATDGSLNPAALNTLPDDVLFDRLLQLRGVGIKVASCVCLFAYGRTGTVPVDTWIRKVIDGNYDGVNPFPVYGKNAGIMQQYIFFYALTHKEEFRQIKPL